MDSGAVAPDWDAVFETLENWRSRLEEREAPSVTAIAKTHGRDPWAVLVSTILSLRTKDEVTLAASRRLLAAAPTPAALLGLGEAETAKLAYPAGFYRTKARNLTTIAALLEDRYRGAVPADAAALLSLPGVGRKTANLVLSEAFDQDAICVDVHVHRICNRLGMVRTQHPDDTEAALQTSLPRKYWKTINALFVLYGQRVCRPVGPRCSLCGLAGGCARVGVVRSR